MLFPSPFSLVTVLLSSMQKVAVGIDNACDVKNDAAPPPSAPDACTIVCSYAGFSFFIVHIKSWRIYCSNSLAIPWTLLFYYCISFLVLCALHCFRVFFQRFPSIVLMKKLVHAFLKTE